MPSAARKAAKAFPPWNVSFSEYAGGPAERVENYILNNDLRNINVDQTLPEKIQANRLTEIVHGFHILQIQKVHDLSAPSGPSSGAGYFEKHSNLLLHLVDGKGQKVQASEFEDLKETGVTKHTVPGTKILVGPVTNLINGVMYLTPYNCQVLGGTVQKLLEQHTTFLNKPPKTCKFDTTALKTIPDEEKAPEFKGFLVALGEEKEASAKTAVPTSNRAIANKNFAPPVEGIPVEPAKIPAPKAEANTRAQGSQGTQQQQQQQMPMGGQPQMQMQPPPMQQQQGVPNGNFQGQPQVNRGSQGNFQQQQQPPQGNFQQQPPQQVNRPPQGNFQQQGNFQGQPPQGNFQQQPPPQVIRGSQGAPPLMQQPPQQQQQHINFQQQAPPQQQFNPAPRDSQGQNAPPPQPQQNALPPQPQQSAPQQPGGAPAPGQPGGAPLSDNQAEANRLVMGIQGLGQPGGVNPGMLPPPPQTQTQTNLGFNPNFRPVPPMGQFGAPPPGQFNQFGGPQFAPPPQQFGALPPMGMPGMGAPPGAGNFGAPPPGQFGAPPPGQGFPMGMPPPQKGKPGPGGFYS